MSEEKKWRPFLVDFLHYQQEEMLYKGKVVFLDGIIEARKIEKEFLKDREAGEYYLPPCNKISKIIYDCLIRHRAPLY